jgi:hypothetical protein
MIWGWLKGSFLLRDLDRNLAVAGIILAILMTVLGLVISRFMYSLMGGLVLISCLLWLVIRKRHTFEFRFPESRILTIVWSICFFGLYILSVLSIYFRPELYERPLLYFVLTAIMAGIIACEIIASGRRYAGLILIQILLLGVSIAWSQLLIFPSLLGIDPWYHSALTNRIVDRGFIPEGNSYSNLPLFHLMIAATSLVASLPYKLANMVSVSLGQIICNGLFVFLIADYLFKNHRIGLLAALMVVIANHHIRMTYWSIPNAFAVVFIPIVIYLALSTAKSNPRNILTLWMSIIMILLMVAIILTHSIAAICMAILLFVAWGASILYKIFYPRVESYVTLSVPLGFTVMMFAWWSYSSGHIKTLSQLMSWGFSVDYFDKTPAEYLNHAMIVPLGEQMFNNLGVYLFWAVSLIGVFYMISRRGNSSTFLVALVGVTPLAITFLSFISETAVIGSRWWYCAQILLSIPLAVSIYLVITWKSRKSLFPYAFVFGFVVILSVFMIMSTSANIDNHICSPVTGSTSAYTQSEMVASDFFAKNTVGVISSDANYCTNPSSSVFSHAYGVDPERLHCLDGSLVFGEFDHDGSVKIVRSKWFHESLMRGGLSLPVRRDLNDYLSNLGFNKIYESPTMSGFIG